MRTIATALLAVLSLSAFADEVEVELTDNAEHLLSHHCAATNYGTMKSCGVVDNHRRLNDLEGQTGVPSLVDDAGTYIGDIIYVANVYTAHVLIPHDGETYYVIADNSTFPLRGYTDLWWTNANCTGQPYIATNSSESLAGFLGRAGLSPSGDIYIGDVQLTSSVLAHSRSDQNTGVCTRDDNTTLAASEYATAVQLLDTSTLVTPLRIQW